MTVYVGIKKLHQDDGTYFYRVSTNDFDGADFYIKIDTLQEKLNFYSTSNFNDPIYSIIPTNPEPQIKVASTLINNRVVPYVIMQVYKAIRDNNFPEYLDYCA